MSYRNLGPSLGKTQNADNPTPLGAVAKTKNQVVLSQILAMQEAHERRIAAISDHLRVERTSAMTGVLPQARSHRPSFPTGAVHLSLCLADRALNCRNARLRISCITGDREKRMQALPNLQNVCTRSACLPERTVYYRQN